MIKDIIIKNIGIKIFQGVGTILLDIGKRKAKETSEEKVMAYTLDIYKSNLDEELLSKYGNEIFYDDLCKVLMQGNNMTMLLERYANRDLCDNQSDLEFIECITESLHLKTYSRSTVKNALYYICNQAYISFNQLKDPENIKLKNIMNTGFAENRHCINGIKNDTDKILSNQNMMLEEIKEIRNSTLMDQKQKSIWENMGIVNPEDIEFLKSGNYNITVMAKNTVDMFCVSAEIKINYYNFSFESFEEYVSYLRFSGKMEEFEVCRLQITAPTGEIVQEYEDHTYRGMKIKLPDFYIDEVRLDPLDFSSMYVCIEPEFKYIQMQIENAEGEVLIPNKKYKIERKIKEELLYIYMKDTSNSGQLITNFIFIVESINPWNSNIKIQISQRDDSRVSSNIEFCNLLERIKNANEIISRNIETGLIGIRSKGLSFRDDFMCDLKVRKDFYRKLLRIENQFGLQFNLPKKIVVAEIDNLNQIIDLLDKGVIDTKVQEMTLTYEQLNYSEESWQDMIDKEPIMLMFHYQKITIFDVEIPVTDYFKIVMFGKLTKINNEQMKLSCQNSYMFNEKLATLSEEQIINNLANGIMNITN